MVTAIGLADTAASHCAREELTVAQIERYAIYETYRPKPTSAQRAVLPLELLNEFEAQALNGAVQYARVTALERAIELRKYAPTEYAP
jgi:hypothetical protein